MDANEYERLNQSIVQHAQKALLDECVAALRLRLLSLPETARIAWVDQFRRNVASRQALFEKDLSVPGADPALSDMMAAMFAEAYADLSVDVMAQLAQPMTRDEQRLFDSLDD